MAGLGGVTQHRFRLRHQPSIGGSIVTVSEIVLNGRSSGGLFDGPGEMRARARAFDWAATPLGPVRHWSPTLRTVVRLCLDSPFPVNLWCGPERVLIYNDAYRRVLGVKHPQALGRPGFDVWAEIRADIEPMFAQIDAG